MLVALNSTAGLGAGAAAALARDTARDDLVAQKDIRTAQSPWVRNDE